MSNPLSRNCQRGHRAVLFLRQICLSVALTHPPTVSELRFLWGSSLYVSPISILLPRAAAANVSCN